MLMKTQLSFFTAAESCDRVLEGSPCLCPSMVGTLCFLSSKANQAVSVSVLELEIEWLFWKLVSIHLMDSINPVVSKNTVHTG